MMKLQSSFFRLSLNRLVILLSITLGNASALASPLAFPGFEQQGYPASPDNAPPKATDDLYAVSENTSLDVPAISGVLTNDVDPDGDSLTAVINSPTVSGSLTLYPDGSFVYTPNPNFTGQDSFTYHAKDGSLDSNLATVTINVQVGNASPVGINDSFVVPLNNALSVSSPGVLINDIDANGDTLTANLGTGPENGTLTLNSDGSFEYTPDTNFFGLDTFTYRASDGVDVSNLATVTIQVLEGNIAPLAENDSYSVVQNQTLSVPAPGVLENDSDVDGDSLIAELDDTSDHGTLALNPDGSFTYTADAGFVGQDFFRYRASDGSAESNRAVVTISVSEGDTQIPEVVWLSPISDGQFLKVGEEIIRLEVSATDNSGIASVRFYRWDAIQLTYVEIGIVYAPPYRWDLDTRLLNWGDNQINVKVYDTYGNESVNHIWLTKLRWVYLPVLRR